MSILIGATWDGTPVNCIFIREIKIGIIVYWNVKINSCKYWVIRRYISDLRPVIADELKSYFGLTKSGTHYYKLCRRYVLLIRSRDPYVSPELSLNKYISNPDNITEDLIEQIRYTYTFRRMSGMTKNNLYVRKVKGILKVFSLFDSYPINNINMELPDCVINKWFDSGNIEFHDCLSDMLGTPKNDEEDKDDLFGQKLHNLNIFLERLILETNPDIIWYQSDIINYIIGKITPR